MSEMFKRDKGCMVKQKGLKKRKREVYKDLSPTLHNIYYATFNLAKLHSIDVFCNIPHRINPLVKVLGNYGRYK